MTYCMCWWRGSCFFHWGDFPWPVLIGALSLPCLLIMVPMWPCDTNIHWCQGTCCWSVCLLCELCALVVLPHVHSSYHHLVTLLFYVSFYVTHDLCPVTLPSGLGKVSMTSPCPHQVNVSHWLVGRLSKQNVLLMVNSLLCTKGWTDETKGKLCTYNEQHFCDYFNWCIDVHLQ